MCRSCKFHDECLSRKNEKVDVPKIRVIESTLLWIVLHGKEVRVYEHAPADGAQNDEAVTSERFVEVEYLRTRKHDMSIFPRL